jgi:hypothetical protein
MQRSRRAFDDALTLWEARDVYRVKAALRGIVVLFFGLEFLGYCTVGYWYLGLVLIGLQCALLWCLRLVLWWARRGLWWCLDHAKVTVVIWLHERRR